MSDLGSRVLVSFGKQSSAFDISSVPGSLINLVPEKQGFYSPEYMKLARNPATPLNTPIGPVRGPLDLKQAIPLENIITGLSGNTGAAIASATTTEIGQILDLAFGTAAIDPSGASTTATGGTGASKTLAVTEMARFPPGTVIMFPVTSPAGNIIRQVRSRAGSSGAGNLTLDRKFTGTVTNGATVIRASRWVDDPSVYEHTLAFFRAQYLNDSRNYFGGMSRASLQFARGQYAKLVTSWLFSDVQEDDVDAIPAITLPTRGSAIMNAGSAFFINDTQYYATDLSADISGALSPRAVDNAPHGILGYIVEKGETKPRAKIKVKLLRGGNSGALNTGEVPDTGAGDFTLKKGQAWDVNGGDPTTLFDVAFAVGNAAGAFCYGVAQQAYCMSAKEIVVDGYKMIDATFECANPSAASIFPFEFHLG